MANRRAIGVFDSGLGGLTVTKEIIKALPSEDIIYFGDTGRVPYGTRSIETIKKYARQDEAFLLRHNVKLIVAACGTVSSVAADTANDLPVPFVGVISNSAEAAVLATKNKKIGVLGTPATINSSKHKEYILSAMPDASVFSAACTMFVPLVEEGWYEADDSIVLETVRRYLDPLIKENVDTIILGCTHYPILYSAIRAVVGEDVTLINPGFTAAQAVADYLNETNNLTDKQGFGTHRFYVTDKTPSFSRIASILLGEEICENEVEQVSINGL